MLCWNVGPYRRSFLSMLVLLSLAVPGCSRDDNQLLRGFKDHNILLVSMDTLRADYLGCYGDPNTTPSLIQLRNRFSF